MKFEESLWGLVARIPGCRLKRFRVRFQALPDFLSSSGSGTVFHSALVRINEELLERKVAAPV
jgi:hypothetical protein